MKKMLIVLSCVAGLAMTVSALEYAVSYTEYGEDCAQIRQGKTPLPAGTVYPVATALKAIPSEYLIIDSGTLREKTTEEKAVYDAAKAAAGAAAEKARQEAKPVELKTVENNYISICDALSGSTNHTKLTILQLQQIGSLMTNEMQKVEITLNLLSVDTAAKRYGGLMWWDDCIWHPEIVE